MNLQVKRLSELATIPTKQDGDAGYDLYSTEDYILQPLERHLFKTDIAMSIPSGYYGRIADRSGNAFKRGLHVMAGVIDSTYRGNIGVVLVSLRYEKAYLVKPMVIGEEIVIQRGERIAQIIFEKYHDFDFAEVTELDQTIRSAGGFGSSGR